MAINRQKISQMTPKGADLDPTDLLEVSVDTGSGYETRSITGQEVIDGVGAVYVPYTGATQDVDLGEFELKAGQLTLDTTPTGTATVGTTQWNDSTGTSETTLKGGSVILKNGVDLVARVVNKVTPNATLTKANYTAVKISGAQGQRLAVGYAQANNDNNSADTIGVVIETIPTNQEGFIMTVGNLEDVNTTGSLQGETWADGDVLYLSPTTPGALTNVKPNGSTGHIVVMGYVEYAHAIHGKIYVKIMNGWELDELHNVYINPATLSDNDLLQYDSATSLWKNEKLEIKLDTTPQLGGNLDVNGYQITSDNDQDVVINPNGVGIVKIESNLHLRDTAGGTAKQINLYEGFSNGSNYIGIKAPDSLSTDTTYTLPTADGTSGQVLSTNGTGTLSWATAGGGITVGTTAVTSGTNGRVFFQAGGVVQQSDRFTFDNTTATNILQLGSGANAGVSLRTIAPGSTNLDIAFRVRNSLDTVNFLVVNGAGDVYNNGAGGVTSNTFYGENAGRVASGDLNTFIGNSAGRDNTTGVNNTFIGNSAGRATVTAGSNTFIGRATGLSNTTGAANTFVGASAGQNSNGSSNLFMGSSSGLNFTTGDGNIFIGTNSAQLQSNGTNLTQANSSIIIGSSSRANGNNQTNQIVIGHQAIGLGSNTTVIGNSSTTTWKLFGAGIVQNITAPSSSLTDSFHVYSNDITAGNAAPHFRTENGAIVKVYQETTAVGASTLVSNAGTNITDTDTFDGYTLKQIVKALRNQGLLA